MRVVSEEGANIDEVHISSASYVQQILHKAPVYYKKYTKTKYKYAATHKMEYKYREDKV
jgi:hypothetical protein